ncbi:MAG: hypothetical protein ACYSUD_20095 [Planctomycetota bacterium]
MKGLIMEFEQDNNLPGPMEPKPAEPISGLGATSPAQRPPKRGSGWRIFWGIVLGLSIMANFVLFLMLIGVVAVFATGQRSA